MVLMRKGSAIHPPTPLVRRPHTSTSLLAFQRAVATTRYPLCVVSRAIAVSVMPRRVVPPPETWDAGRVGPSVGSPRRTVPPAPPAPEWSGLHALTAFVVS